MDTRKVESRWKVLKGTIVEQVGKIMGNEKMQSDGEAQRVRGKIGSAVNSSPGSKSK